MNEYYLHDTPNGRPQTPAQVWRDAHTVDQLAYRIREHLTRINGWQPLQLLNAKLPLTLQE